MKAGILTCGLIILSVASAIAQNPASPGNTADRIIESGNLIIEILKVINSGDDDKTRETPSKEKDCATKNFTNICFVNKSSRIIIVSLKPRKTEDNYQLVIDNNGKECCYRVKPGIYLYSIEQQSSLGTARELIRKGEVQLEVCNDMEIKIR